MVTMRWSISELNQSNYVILPALYIDSHKQLKNGIRCLLEIIFGRELFCKSTTQLKLKMSSSINTFFSVIC